jgi:hypothetical protein
MLVETVVDRAVEALITAAAVRNFGTSDRVHASVRSALGSFVMCIFIPLRSVSGSGGFPGLSCH